MTGPERLPPSARVVVRNPRGAIVARSPASPGVRELAEQTGLGELLIRSLIRAQLRLALRLAAVFGFLLGGLPLLFALAPGVGQVRVLGLALPWLLLGVLVYPMLLGAGWLYVRFAEANERDFTELVERS